MRSVKPIILAGSIILTMGIIFNLQGQSVVGPQASFMYSNPEWISNGIQIMIIGAALIATGISLFFIKTKRSP